MLNSQPLTLQVAALTHVGLRRQSNEDCVAVNDRILRGAQPKPEGSLHPLDGTRFCLVADGMGGHPAGDVASRIAVESIVAGLAGTQPSRERVIEVLREANRGLFAEMARCPERYGMGTTVAGLVVDAQKVAAFNVGASRIYKVLEGRVEQLSVDDSEAGGLGWLLFGHAPTRVLNQCLGGFPDAIELAPHVIELPATPGSAFLLCSDGLSDMLSDEAIGACLAHDPGRSVQKLLEAALEAGGIDNISIVLARIGAASSIG
jgi:serine/threonine protein phosphatase PrpC